MYLSKIDIIHQSKIDPFLKETLQIADNLTIPSLLLYFLNQLDLFVCHLAISLLIPVQYFNYYLVKILKCHSFVQMKNIKKNIMDHNHLHIHIGVMKGEDLV